MGKLAVSDAFRRNRTAECISAHRAHSQVHASRRLTLERGTPFTLTDRLQLLYKTRTQNPSLRVNDLEVSWGLDHPETDRRTVRRNRPSMKPRAIPRGRAEARPSRTATQSQSGRSKDNRTGRRLV